MTKKEAWEVITAHAACAIVNGCDLCPLYRVDEPRERQQAKCQDAITGAKLREALVTLRGDRKE